MKRGLLLVGIGRAASLVAGVALLAWLARQLRPEGFGVLQFAIALMVYPALLVDLGLTTYGVREIAERSVAQRVIESVVSARVALALATSVVVLVLVAVVPVSADTRLIFGVLATGLAAAALNFRWVLQGQHRFGRMALVDVLGVIVPLVLALALVARPSDIAPAAAAIVIGAWVASGASIVLAGPLGGFRLRFDANARGAIQTSIRLGIAAIAISVYYSIDTVLLGIFRSSGEVGYYAAAYRLILPVLGLATTVGVVALPRLVAEMRAEPALAEQTASQLAYYLILVAAPAAVGGAILAERIIVAVYDTSFEPAAVPFGILVLTVFTVYSNAAFAFLLLARRADAIYLRATVSGAVLNVGLNVVAIPMAGVVGAALATIASELLVLGAILHATREVAVPACAAAIRSIALPTGAMALAAWVLRDSLIAVPVAASVYALALVATGGLRAPRAPVRLPGGLRR